MPELSEPAPLPQLIASDLDGTLLRHDHSISPRTGAALAAAGAAGIQIVFVTGRPARWMGVVSEHLHGQGVAICGNGAAVVDLRDGGRLIEVRPLPRENALAVVHALRSAAPGVTFAVERTGGLHQEPTYPPMTMDPAVEVAPVEKLLAEGDAYRGAPVLKLLAKHDTLTPDDFLALARARVGSWAQVTRSSPSALLEISAPEVSKATTLALRCARNGIDPSRVIAFGDMPNDVEMLTWAGTGYAMANAHPAVLAATEHRTESNENDGVALVIERLLATHR
ncbi:HAD family hydrolase [Streptomyces sp. DSM 44915]|uniref:HAD family hydrolase n=1 Tax=Streptomyces chisholmiae TaxID=3075540 RepID=A0ABU2JQ80_9ACTN|nr:HAD family hydrolase [Streptomyces sp. DSM 44915]MDT0267152.1 HAD family hydrolase [Streptomyces sp. DSM 44915]